MLLLIGIFILCILCMAITLCHDLYKRGKSREKIVSDEFVESSDYRTPANKIITQTQNKDKINLSTFNFKLFKKLYYSSAGVWIVGVLLFKFIKFAWGAEWCDDDYATTKIYIDNSICPGDSVVVKTHNKSSRRSIHMVEYAFSYRERGHSLTHYIKGASDLIIPPGETRFRCHYTFLKETMNTFEFDFDSKYTDDGHPSVRYLFSSVF